MFGLISKKKLLKKMNELLESGRQENNGAKYPPENEKDEHWNIMTRGYEDGHCNFYNALHSEFFLSNNYVLGTIEAIKE